MKKLLQEAIDNPSLPLYWGKNQPGMQATVEMTPEEAEVAKRIWFDARDAAVEHAQRLVDIGAHKQIANRLLEPFTHITVLVSSTQWSNFLALRDHHMAEPHIAILAREISKCLDNDPIQSLEYGQWHLPFIMEADKVDARYWVEANRPARGEGHGSGMAWHDAGVPWFKEMNRRLLKLSVSRCASTSYKTVDGFDMTMEKAVEVHDKLVGSAPLHASPTEHTCFADAYYENHNQWMNPKLHGNFEGFVQYRKTLKDECL